MIYSRRTKSLASIYQRINGSLAFLANGLFLRMDAALYFVSCVHVFSRAMPGEDTPAEKDSDGKIYLKLYDKDRQTFTYYEVELADPSNKRKWLKNTNFEEYWDVAAIQLNEESLSVFDIEAWEEEDLLPSRSVLSPCDQVLVLTSSADTCGHRSQFDIGAELHPQALQDELRMTTDRAALIKTEGVVLSYGNSGSPVYRFLPQSCQDFYDNESDNSSAPIQLVGIIVGALEGAPDWPYFHYIDTAVRVVRERHGA